MTQFVCCCEIQTFFFELIQILKRHFRCCEIEKKFFFRIDSNFENFDAIFFYSSVFNNNAFKFFFVRCFCYCYWYYYFFYRYVCIVIAFTCYFAFFNFYHQQWFFERKNSIKSFSKSKKSSFSKTFVLNEFSTNSWLLSFDSSNATRKRINAIATTFISKAWKWT